MKKFKPTNLQKARLSSWVEKWQKRLNLEEWDCQKITIEDQNDPESPTTNAEITYCGTYLRFSLVIYPRYFTEHTTKQQEKIIVHELCHNLTGELYSIARDGQNLVLTHSEDIRTAWERLTQRICNVAWKGWE